MFNKLPFRVTLLLCLVLTFTAWNILRAWTALSWQNALTEFSVQSPTWVIALSGIAWALSGFVLLWGIWSKKLWVKKFLLGVAGTYTTWYWVERVFWQMPRPNWPFAVILNLLLVLFIFYTTKSPTREAHER